MGAAYFYHLTESPVEAVLLMLVPRALENDWRVEVRGQAPETMSSLDTALWRGPEDRFLPHGLAGGTHDADQPVLLTAGQAAANDPTCVMSVEGAEVTVEEVIRCARVCVLFDGHDAAALERARNQWKALTEAGCSAQYWAQAGGRWEKKAER